MRKSQFDKIFEPRMFFWKRQEIQQLLGFKQLLGDSCVCVVRAVGLHYDVIELLEGLEGTTVLAWA